MTTTSDALYQQGDLASILRVISYRQLDYWCRYRHITPEVEGAGSGSRRAWTRVQVAKLCVIEELVVLLASQKNAHTGISATLVSQVWNMLSDDFSLWPPELHIGPGPTALTYRVLTPEQAARRPVTISIRPRLVRATRGV